MKEKTITINDEGTFTLEELETRLHEVERERDHYIENVGYHTIAAEYNRKIALQLYERHMKLYEHYIGFKEILEHESSNS